LTRTTTFFEDLKEAVKGSLLFSILRDGTKEELHFVEIELLGKDEWGGLAELPEIIAAFVQPNDPAVQAVLRDASKLLEKAGQKSSIEGYQSQSPKRVSTIVSAIWSAVCQLDLTYAVCPASFESQGQKIRKPSKVFETKLATCLDLSVFFASCLEQAGLHSVIFFTNDHVAIGCWLQDEDFSTSVIDSLQALRKRFQLKELLFFETTLTTNRPPTSFKFAVEETVKLLNNEQDFALAVDINRARHSKIRPVSDKDFKPYKAADADYVSVPLDILDDIPEESMVSSEPEKVSEGDLSNQRLERWKRKLLDLSLRNPLLNFRATKRIVTIDCPDLGYLEDQLADGKSLKFYATELLQDDGLRDGDIHKKQRQEELRKEKIVNALSKGEILTKLAKNDQLNSNLLELYRAAKGALQEGGSNILYLALGFLVWKQSESAELVHKAPLILIPVELTRKSVLSGFRLTLHEEEPRFNPTLLELLRQDFKLFLKELEGDLPTDTSGLDVAKIWRIVRTAIRDIPKWEVTEEAVLSTFSFSKYLMWCDLESRHEQLKNSPLVRHLIETPRDPYKDAGFVNANEIDENTHPKDIFCPLLADSSQLVACMTAAKGDSDFVLIGPPGTGKSQTIANMISQCLANGKTVLFVSEKTAALEVVYRRLRGINLDKFCLQLHSNKARKLEVIQQLGAAWDAEAQAAENWDKEADRLYNLRLDLSKYVSCLHKRHKNGMSIYRAIGLILKHEDTPNVNLQWPNYQAHDENDFEMLQEITKRIDINRSECGGLHENPLKEITLSGWSPSWQSQVSAKVAKLREKKNDCKSAFIEYTELLKLPVSLVSKPQLEALSELPAILSFAATNPCDFAFSASPAIIVEQMKMACKHIEDFQTLNDALSVPYNRDIFQKEDVPALMKQWEEGCQSFIVKKWLSQKTVKKTMAAYVKNKEKQRLEHDFPILADIKNVLTEIEKLSELKQCLGPAWKEVDVLVKQFRSLIPDTERYRKISVLPRLSDSN